MWEYPQPPTPAENSLHEKACDVSQLATTLFGGCVFCEVENTLMWTLRWDKWKPTDSETVLFASLHFGMVSIALLVFQERTSPENFSGCFGGASLLLLNHSAAAADLLLLLCYLTRLLVSS